VIENLELISFMGCTLVLGSTSTLEEDNPAHDSVAISIQICERGPREHHLVSKHNFPRERGHAQLTTLDDRLAVTQLFRLPSLPLGSLALKRAFSFSLSLFLTYFPFSSVSLFALFSPSALMFRKLGNRCLIARDY
jgi:hypothetical protein